MTTNLYRIAPLAAAALISFSSLACARTIQFSGTFAAAGDSTSKGTGTLSGSIDTDSDKLTYDVTFSDLSGPITAAHFHGPADPGQDAGVMLPVPGPYETGMHGSLQANEATAQALLDGKTYLNLHTKKYPKGEIRAQVMVTK